MGKIPKNFPDTSKILTISLAKSSMIEGKGTEDCFVSFLLMAPTFWSSLPIPAFFLHHLTSGEPMSLSTDHGPVIQILCAIVSSSVE